MTEADATFSSLFPHCCPEVFPVVRYPYPVYESDDVYPSGSFCGQPLPDLLQKRFEFLPRFLPPFLEVRADTSLGNLSRFP